MAEQDGSLKPITPRHTGAGATPQAALLRCITPLREQQPALTEAIAALRSAMTIGGITQKSLSMRVDYSMARLGRILREEEEISLSELNDLIESSKIDKNLYRSRLRDVQRERDRVKDPM